MGSVWNVYPAAVVGRDGKIHILYRAIGGPAVKVWGGDYTPSSIGYASTTDGQRVDRFDNPFLKPNSNKGQVGFEDPRMVRVEEGNVSDVFFSVVTKLDGDRAKVEIGGVQTEDFRTSSDPKIVNIKQNPLDKIIHRGAFLCKGGTYFPMRVNGRLAFLYTQSADSPTSTIMYTEVKDQKDLFAGKFQSQKLLVPSKGIFRGPEVGAPPIKTDKGWLLIYSQEAQEAVWTIGAALLDLKDPTRVLSQLHYPLLRPDRPYETTGNVENVVFASGALIRDEDLYVYYGAADTVVGLAKINLKTLLKEL